MDSIFKLMQNAENLEINIDKLIEYMAIVQIIDGAKPEQTIKQFENLLERINNIWNKDDSDEWENVKCVAEEYGIELENDNGYCKSFNSIFAAFLHTYHSYSAFAKAEFITALAGEEYRNTFLSLVENFNKEIDVEAVKTVAAAMLKATYKNKGVNGNG